MNWQTYGSCQHTADTPVRVEYCTAGRAFWPDPYYVNESHTITNVQGTHAAMAGRTQPDVTRVEGFKRRTSSD